MPSFPANVVFFVLVAHSVELTASGTGSFNVSGLVLSMTEGMESKLGVLEAKANEPKSPLQIKGVQGGNFDIEVQGKGDIDIRLGVDFDGQYILSAGNGGGFIVDVSGTQHTKQGPGRGTVGNGSLAAARPYGYTRAAQSIEANTADGTVRLEVSESADTAENLQRPAPGELYPCMIDPSLPGCVIVAADCSSCPRPLSSENVSG